MRLLTVSLLCFGLLTLAGCSDAPKAEVVHTVPAGEKAAIGHLTYNVVDSQILSQLGEPAAPRVPHDRFLIIQIAITNSSNVENPIPAIELVADSGTVYNELTDGTGVANWFGLVRRVGPGQTARGEVLFDAPAAHYKLRFSDEATNGEIMADFPLSYSHEKDAVVPTSEIPEPVGPAGPQKTK